ncbi:protein MAK11 [Sporothrix brasiliensis 5110]|uniref:Protein MAK11 n=1 Tax=Sporothrix brasiliensis 5110 TaxID=1398154 RepID=A0A0C2EUG2_9PEZI|nr:protein MAK11 [Sporothrix brasiliensis 5110]KIH90169.1 protein MAK11 [Sporothrix brasiliensis 5110]
MKRKREAKASVVDPEVPAATRPKTKATPTPTPTTSKTPTSILKMKSSLKSTTSSSTAANVASTRRKDKTPKSAKTAAVAASAPAPATATASANSVVALGDAPAALQIVAGSYDRTLHGVVATVTPAGVRFTDTFLFNAHSSAIRCLALSPPSAPIPGQGQKIMLATGSTDERINIYNLSAHAPADASGLGASDEERAIMAAVTSRPVMPIAENAKNRELGTLLHHASSITKLSFPTRSKLLSASEDSTIAVTRTRDWSLLSMIKAPVPKEGMGGGLRRPSGDTAPPGGAPSGVNDFAVHPSMKVMISVSRGERSMRLWNLVTGKKAGVLNFSKDLLRELGEGRFATGEGRQVVWGRTFGCGSADADADADDGTDEYAIGFDRNVVVFGMDSLPRCKVLSDALTKTHDFCYVEVGDDPDAPAADKAGLFSLLAVATEDGRILLCSTRNEDLVAAPASATPGNDKKAATAAAPLPSGRLIGQLGGNATGVTGRVKAFKILPVLEPVDGAAKGDKKRLQKAWYVVSATSTGMLRVWKITGQELRRAYKNSTAISASGSPLAAKPKQLGTLLGAYQTPDRITCVEAFVMIPRPDGVEDSDVEDDDEEEEEDDDDE